MNKDLAYCLELAKLTGLGDYSKGWSHVSKTQVRLRFNKPKYTMDMIKSTSLNTFIITIHPLFFDSMEIRMQLSFNRLNKTMLAKRLKSVLRGVKDMSQDF